MSTSRWLILYFLILLADLLLISLKMDVYRFASKPLLIPVLAVYFLSMASPIPRGRQLLMYAALFFSFLGDVLLLSDNLFLPGLGSFLVAHLFYIAFFLKIRYANHPVPLCKYGIVLLNAGVVIGFILFLMPYLGNLAIPVIIYSIAISITLQSTVHAFFFRIQPAGWYCVAGAILFILSDSLIALGKFYHPVAGSGIWVMLTYGLAQAGLVYGATKYFAALPQLTTPPPFRFQNQ